MNILVINHYAGGGDLGMEYRPWHLGKEWVKAGHRVFVVAADHSPLRLHNPSVRCDLESEQHDGITYIWLKTPAYEGSLRRIANMLVFVAKLNCYAKKIARLTKPDVVVASSTYPLDNYPACKIARRCGAKYIYEVHDLWPLSPMLIGGYSPCHPFIRVMQRAEDYAYRNVDKVVSLLWNSESHMREHGLPAGRFVCVPNGYDPADWTEERCSLPLPEVHQQAFEGLRGKTIVGFAGGFAASGALMTLLKAAALLKEDERLHFLLVGKGPEQATYEAFISSQKLGNVTLLPAVSKDLIPSLDSHFDIAYLGGVHSQLHKYGTSANKMTDYMLSSLPIIHAIDEPGSVVEQVGCGVQVEAENEELVAKSILQLAALSNEERGAMGRRGRDYVQRNLKWSSLAESLLKSI